MVRTASKFGKFLSMERWIVSQNKSGEYFFAKTIVLQTNDITSLYHFGLFFFLFVFVTIHRFIHGKLQTNCYSKNEIFTRAILPRKRCEIKSKIPSMNCQTMLMFHCVNRWLHILVKLPSKQIQSLLLNYA